MIQIMSRKKAIEFITNNPFYPIVAIGETNNDNVLELVSKAKDHILLRFDDVEFERHGYKQVTLENIKHAIEWAKDKDDLIVACLAGISRSAAIAYLIGCSKVSPQEAINVLDKDIHLPNIRVVELGSEVLENKEVLSEYHRWIDNCYR